ncbi:MAG: capsule assembly Wzi family protein [Pseudomonadota bacterium]
MKSMEWARRWCLALAVMLYGTARSFASPWAEVGDNQLRGDIELLAAAGVIDDVTTHWPLPWQSIVKDLRNNSLPGQPASVRAAAARVLARAHAENSPGFSASLVIDAASKPSVVYGFDGMGRGDGQGQFILDYNSQNTAARLALGGFSQNFRGNSSKLMPDQSYLAEKFGPVLFYGGYLSHWWGPGWISALSLSNNARPMPQIGFERLDTSASTWPVLRWLGPWQLEFLVGLLDGPRIQPNTFYNGLRFTFNPAPGLEIGLARTEEFCGQGHPCVPIRDYFNLQNDPKHTNKTNDEGLIDIKYSRTLGSMPVQIYMSLMNEDTSPFVHSGTSHLFGASIFLPSGGGTPVRLTWEYTDSVPTANIFSFGDVYHGFAYTNGQFVDGMRYRDRTLGFSLDSDSRLLSFQGAWSDGGGRFYELSFHHAQISNLHIGNAGFSGINIVTAAPVLVNLGEARITIPLRWMKLDLAGRLQDDQPRPNHGFAASFEAGLRIGL